MNTIELELKIDNILKELKAAFEETKQLDAERIALEKLNYSISDREKKLVERELTVKQKEDDIASQKKYIDTQTEDAQRTLARITLEKEGLKNLEDRKTQLDKDQAQLDAEKQSLETFKKEKEEFNQQRTDFEEEKKLFAREKLAMLESQQLLAQRENNIKLQEEKLDKIERMTQI